MFSVGDMLFGLSVIPGALLLSMIPPLKSLRMIALALMVVYGSPVYSAGRIDEHSKKVGLHETR